MKLKNIVLLVGVLALMIPAASAATNLRVEKDWYENFDLYTRVDVSNANEIAVCSNHAVSHGYITLRLKNFDFEDEARAAALELLQSVEGVSPGSFQCFRTTI